MRMFVRLEPIRSRLKSRLEIREITGNYSFCSMFRTAAAGGTEYCGSRETIEYEFYLVITQTLWRENRKRSPAISVT
jgi:hypothetical protein